MSYFQEIVISPDIFEKIRDAYTTDADIDIDLKSYKDNLTNKCIVFDKNKIDSVLYKKIEDIIKSSNDFAKNKLDSVLRQFLSPGQIKFKNRSLDIKWEKDAVINNLINVGINTESHIINSEINLLMSLVSTRKELNNIEVLDIENFISPKKPSKVFSLNKTIEIKQGEIFYFEEYFKPYIYDARKMIINDRYIRIRNRGMINFEKILKLSPQLEKLTIQTILRENNPKDKFDISPANFKSEIETIVGKEIHLSSNTEHKRFIQTEEYKIIIDPGFDFVNRDYIAENNPITVTFKKI